MTSKNEAVGYIFSRKIDGGYVSHRVQNIIIRNYANEKQVNYSLSATEFSLEGAYNVLFEALNNYSEILFYSIRMLPDGELFEKLTDLVIKNDLRLHFCAEDYVVDKSTVAECKLNMKIKKIAEDIFEEGKICKLTDNGQR